MLMVFPACQAKLLMLSSILQIYCGALYAVPNAALRAIVCPATVPHSTR